MPKQKTLPGMDTQLSIAAETLQGIRENIEICKKEEREAEEKFITEMEKKGMTAVTHENLTFQLRKGRKSRDRISIK